MDDFGERNDLTPWPRWALALSVVLFLIFCAASAFIPVVPIVLVAVLALVYACFSAGPFPTVMLFLAAAYCRPSDLIPALAIVKPALTFALLSVALFIVERMMSGKFELANYRQGKFAFILFIHTIASAVFATHPGIAFQVLDLFSKVILIYFLLLNVVSNSRRCIIFQNVLLANTLFLASMLIHTYIKGEDLVEGTRAGLQGTMLSDPNDAALVMLMGTPFALHRALDAKGWSRFYYIVATGLLLFALTTTQSRGGMLGLAAAVGVMYARTLMKRLWVLPILVVFLMGIYQLSGIGDRRTAQTRDGELDSSSQQRIDLWKSATSMMLSRPLTGVGIGLAPINNPVYGRGFAAGAVKDTHSTYFKCAGETGVIGIFLFMSLCFMAIQSALRVYLRSESMPPGQARSMGQALLPTVAAALMSATFLSHTWVWFLWTMFAQTAVTERHLFGRPSKALADEPPAADPEPAVAVPENSGRAIWTPAEPDTR